MLRSSLCDCSDAYIVVKGTITVVRMIAPARNDASKKKVIFKNCTSFTKFISKIKNTIQNTSRWCSWYWCSNAIIMPKFLITDTNFYVPVITLSTQDNAKLLKKLKSGFKRTINWNKYQSKMSTERQNNYLDYSIDPSF